MVRLSYPVGRYDYKAINKQFKKENKFQIHSPQKYLQYQPFKPFLF